jgi:hypothetical protein
MPRGVPAACVAATRARDGRRLGLVLGLAAAVATASSVRAQAMPGEIVQEPATAEAPAQEQPTSEVPAQEQPASDAQGQGQEVPEVSAAAQRFFDEGIAALQREDYATALVAFERARALEERPVLLFNIAMCRRALLQYPEAIAAFRQYLVVADADTSEERRQQVRDLIAEMEGNLARVTVRADQDGATVLLDGRRVGSTPLAQVLELGPGSHVLEVRKDGYRDARVSFDVMAGETRDLAVALEPLAVSPEPLPIEPVAGGEEEDGGVVESWWFWTLIGAVVVGGAVTTAVLLWPEDEEPAAIRTIVGP